MQNFKDISILGSRATFGAGITYAELTSHIAKKGFALANMPSTPHLNIVGSVITGSHGSGHKNQIIAGQIKGFELITADGTKKEVGPKEVKDYIINFGCLGVITNMTIQLVKSYKVHKSIFLDMPFENATKIMRDKDIDYLSMFTNFSDRKFNSVWVGSKSKMVKLPGLKETQKVHPVPGMDNSCCTSAGKGPWNEKIYHFVPNLPPSANGEEIQSEYFVPFERY